MDMPKLSPEDRVVVAVDPINSTRWVFTHEGAYPFRGDYPLETQKELLTCDDFTKKGYKAADVSRALARMVPVANNEPFTRILS
jgi:hypothetical protein